MKRRFCCRVAVLAVACCAAAWAAETPEPDFRTTGGLPFPDSLYLAIDLAAGNGENAVYPVVPYDAEPQGGWSDEFKTGKLLLRRIPPGVFSMGSPPDETGRNPLFETRHGVTIDKPFYIGVFEVTQKQWELVMGSNPSYFKGAMRPVERVSYSAIRGGVAGEKWPVSREVDTTSFMGRLRARTVGATGLTWDLPTEAQWEYACRAGTTAAFANGGNLSNDGAGADPQLDGIARYWHDRTDAKGGYGTAHTAVGSYPANAWGLFDMHGNAWEWCLDWWREDLGTEAERNPAGPPDGSFRVLRGGSWNDDARDCRSASRYAGAPSLAERFLGFRLAGN